MFGDFIARGINRPDPGPETFIASTIKFKRSISPSGKTSITEGICVDNEEKYPAEYEKNRGKSSLEPSPAEPIEARQWGGGYLLITVHG